MVIAAAILILRCHDPTASVGRADARQCLERDGELGVHVTRTGKIRQRLGTACQVRDLCQEAWRWPRKPDHMPIASASRPASDIRFSVAVPITRQTLI